MGKSTPAPPPAPDYAGAAQQTAQGNLEAARATATANRVNQYTPYGSIEFTQPTSNPDKWSMTQKLSPAQQKLFNQNQAINQQLGDVAQTGVGYVQQSLNDPLSLGGMYDIGTPEGIQQEASDAAYANASRYLDPQFQNKRTMLENRLANQGITQGSEAYNNAISALDMEEQKAYEGARNQAYLQGLSGAGQQFGQGTTLRQQQLAEAQLLRQDPLNMLNAVRTGSQMQTAQMPQQMQYNTQNAVAGPDMLGAAQAQGQYDQNAYNAQLANQSNRMSGLMGLAGAGVKAYGMMNAPV